MTDLSILIPARNERFLFNTIEDIKRNIRADTEIIAVLDGAWADPPIPDDPHVTLLYYAQSIGQRAATNAAARIARGKYVMKVDAHCAFAEGFDAVMLSDIQDDWTMTPLMRNLHAFDWVCEDGHRRYQGPSGVCKECGKPTVMDVVWIAKPSPQSTSYCFDSEPHFQYFGEFKRRPNGRGDLTETMSLQGSCFMMTRDKYFELGVCDEVFGSWGSQGIEVACKTWLSGGRVVVNHKTWQAHLFRTQGFDFSFPYPISGKQVQHAKRMARELFFNNAWPKQIHPLSWLLERFWPVPGWTDEDLARVAEAGAIFTTSSCFANKASSLSSGDVRPEKMTSQTVCLSGGSRSLLNSFGAGENILALSDQPQMNGVATSPVSANMVDDTAFHTTGDGAKSNNVHKPMDKMTDVMSGSENTIPSALFSTSPIPASSIGINIDPRKESSELIVSEGGVIIGNSHSIPPLQVSSRLESERATTFSDLIISRGILYYTDNRIDQAIMHNCQEQLRKSVNGHQIISVSLAPIDFGTNIVLPFERGYLTLFRQILIGLELLTVDVVYMTEHDCLYPPEHFEFVPPERDRVYYNTNVWKTDGEHYLHYDCKQTSGLVAYRDVLVKHYRERVRRVEAEGYSRKMGFEPGTHNRTERVDDLKSAAFQSARPIVDIRHGNNLTPSRWKRNQFRNQRYTAGWTEADHVPGWPDVQSIFAVGIQDKHDRT